METDPKDESAESAPKRCPRCNAELQTLLLLGVVPDGYVCTHCELYYNDDLQPLARIL
jgi:hypothetical protein